MELKDYQANALEAFGRWLDALSEAQAQSDTVITALQDVGADIPEDIGNYPKTAWQKLSQSGGVPETAGAYVDRTDEARRPIPHVCFKIPTGGGKTLLAAAALERLRRQTGLVLWITPTNAIYEQTKAALKNKEHPYRQLLEIASGGRVKLMEKDDPFTRSDAASYLCVMLLSLPAANRQKGREFLRMFRDSGRYPTFFPDNDDPLGDGKLLRDCPDLERTCVNPDCAAKQDKRNQCRCGKQWLTGPVKHSLFNVFKMLRPVVVLDEAHKAYGAKKQESNQEFARAVSRLDPSLVIELSATPNRGISNLLVDISGPELKRAQMIKAPVQVTSYPTADWRNTLSEAADRLNTLEAEARSLQNSGGDYIRPIAVVRVERTGNDQQDTDHIHAEDVRRFLITNLAVPENAVRVKSSYNDELRGENLLSDFSPVRWIITKNALMEGWDCSFAYVLVMLDNTQAQRAITQLVGRVLRQPHARKTGQEALDHCYVYCWNTDVRVAVDQVKNGLEQEGLSGLGDEVIGASADSRRVTIERRNGFRGHNIFLPLVLHQDGDAWVELDYQRHILPRIDWATIKEPDPQGSLADPAKRQTASVDVGDTLPVFHESQELDIDKTVNVSFFARQLSDITPNAWQASRIARQWVERQRTAGESDDHIYDRRSYLAYALRESVKDQVEERAERIFRDKLRQREIRFDLETGQPNFQMKESYEISVPEDSGLMTGNNGHQLRFNLFEPVYTQQFDSALERNFARYLDEQKALQWWHRIAVRQHGDYYLRGWKQERIWPDFIAMAGNTDGKPHVLVFETKGEHLKGNDDTEYKSKVLETLESAFNAGTMKISDGPAKGTFRLVFNDVEFPQALANLQGAYKA